LKKNKETTLIVLSYKTQLRSLIVNNAKISYFVTNGMISKKLELEKSQKKNDKLSMLNLSEISLKLNTKTNLVVLIKHTSSKILKIINFIKKKKILSNIFIYSPKTPFSLSKIKKIKSIKRKLAKKYAKIKNM